MLNRKLPLIGIPFSDLSSIIQAGVLAPSADNQHCFELRAEGDGLLLFGTEAYLATPYHKKVLSLISFGAVVENMGIRAARLGYHADVLWYPDASRPALIAELRLGRSDPNQTALDGAISARHTNRSVIFRGPALADVDLANFRQLAKGIDGVTLHFFDNPKQRAELLHLIRIAEAERFNTQAMHADIFSAVRFDVGWHASAEVGLPPAALAVEPGARWAFTQLRHWSVMNRLRKIGFHHALALRAAYLPCRLAPHLGVLTTRLPIERGAPAVGRALERIWLEAETLGLAFQPFAGSALLSLAQYREVPAETAEALRRGWTNLTDETPLMVFRLGRAERPVIRTGRQRADSFLRN
ncbi:hypothetical protein [Accumulibacter sp.]|uniref:hypothetical protein n=1 Tax=Accumulibacter sp. TaxID=2053492 RepID=UPI00258CD75B|nr:hypothetical protein [Accumulibacter sp.]